MLKRLLVATVLAAAIPVAAHAATAVSGFGPRLGFSVSPDQFVFGGQLTIGEVAPKLTFDPNLELGFGDSETVIAMNFDMHYNMAVSGSDWRPYFGAGFGVNFLSQDRKPPTPDETNTEVGGNLIVGAGVPTHSGNRFFSELKFGLGSDIPQLKLMVGWNFR